MPRTTAGRIFAVTIVLILGTGAGFVRYFNDSYSVALDPPTESWLHDLPWQYPDLYGNSADQINDGVFFARGEAEVVVMTRTVPPFTSSNREPFERGFTKAIRDGSGARTGACARVTTEQDAWNCIEWTVVVEGVRVKHRAYLSGRGVTKTIVVFTAPDRRFSVFGDPHRWLASLHWQGPSFLYAL